MSETPPPFGEEDTKVDAQASSTVDIDLNDDKAETPEESAPAKPSDDLFFSTISDPEVPINNFIRYRVRHIVAS